LGLIDQVVSQKDLTESAAVAAQEFARRYSPAFESIKKLFRGGVSEEMRRMDLRYRDEMVDIWYSEQTWEQLQHIKIHE
jgi:enoyl-CoA hydratase/carnithine racemase